MAKRSQYTDLGLGDEGQTTATAGQTVGMLGHEDALTARLVGAGLTETLNLVVTVHLVELQDGQLDLLVLVLDLLGGGVDLGRAR